MPGSLLFYQLGYQMLHDPNSDILIILLFHIPIFIAPQVKVLEILLIVFKYLLSTMFFFKSFFGSD